MLIESKPGVCYTMGVCQILADKDWCGCRYFLVAQQERNQLNL